MIDNALGPWTALPCATDFPTSCDGKRTPPILMHIAGHAVRGLASGSPRFKPRSRREAVDVVCGSIQIANHRLNGAASHSEALESRRRSTRTNTNKTISGERTAPRNPVSCREMKRNTSHRDVRPFIPIYAEVVPIRPNQDSPLTSEYIVCN